MINWKDHQVDYSALGFRFEVSPESLGVAPLIKKILESDNGCLSHFYQEGYSDTAFDEIQKRIADLKGRKIYETITKSAQDNLYIWDDACIEVSYSKSKLMSITSVSGNADITKMCKEIAALFTTSQKKGYVFAITTGPSGLRLTRMGYAGSPIEKGNYSDDVCKDYDYIIEDLKSKDPMGRIVILDGPAGTGKTTMLKGILMEVPKAMFVIVPPNMVASIGGPELMPLLMQTKEDYQKKGPVILILEDADECLAPRAGDNMSAISSILNLGDGIMGSLFDIRILATTNAKARELDQAITRDMRLSKRISIQPAKYDQANRIYKRIFKDDSKELPKPVEAEEFSMKPKNEKKSFTLAEIYKLARENGWKPETTKEEDIDGGSGKSYRFHSPEELFDDGEDYL